MRAAGAAQGIHAEVQDCRAVAARGAGVRGWRTEQLREVARVAGAGGSVADVNLHEEGEAHHEQVHLPQSMRELWRAAGGVVGAGVYGGVFVFRFRLTPRSPRRKG